MDITPAWRRAIDDYLSAQRAGGAPATTCATRRQHLEHMARRIGSSPWRVKGDELVEWCGAQEWKPETRRGRRVTFLSFWGWAVRSRRTRRNPAVALPRVKTLPPESRAVPDLAYHEALAAAGPRERLILRLAAELGLRRAEIAQAHSCDVVDDLLGASLVVHGKGGKTRIVAMPQRLADDLRALGEGYFFPGDDEGHLSPRWVGKIGSTLLPGEWTLHKLRHRFAKLYYDVEADIFGLQETLGHSSPDTTRRYVPKRGDSARRTIEAIAS